MHKRTMVSAAIALALSLATPALAAPCKVNITIENQSSNKVVCIKVNSKTRANPRWITMNYHNVTFGQTAFGDRVICARPRQSQKQPVTFPIVGCGVKRALQVEARCHDTKGNRTGETHIFNVGYHRLRDRTFRYACK